MKSRIISSLIIGSVAMLAVSSAQAFTLQNYKAPSLADSTLQGNGTWMVNTLLAGNSDITLVPGSVNYIGAYQNQGGITSDGNIVLSTGAFQTHTPGKVAAPNGQSSGTGGNAGLAGLIGAATNQTFDQNVLTFQFTVNDPSIDSIAMSFVFASDEFLNLAGSRNNDVFAFWVDGVNYAFLPDGSVVSVKNIGENWIDGTDYGYKGRTEEISITALLDPARDVHTITIAIADAAYATARDSTVFLGSFAGKNSNAANPTIPAIPEPETWAMLLAGLGIVGVTTKSRRRMK